MCMCPVITSSYVRIIWYIYILENLTLKIRLFTLYLDKKKLLTAGIENPKKFSELFEPNTSVSVLVLCSGRRRSVVTR